MRRFERVGVGNDAPPVSRFNPRCCRRTLGGGTGKLDGARLSDQRRMQGAFGKTSGRSDFPNAPLRATSSDLRSSMSGAIAKTLPTCIPRTFRRVGFAQGRKLLREFTNLQVERSRRFL
jgi:hypothetical protein